VLREFGGKCLKPSKLLALGTQRDGCSPHRSLLILLPKPYRSRVSKRH
jgi:hypothetical protein